MLFHKRKFKQLLKIMSKNQKLFLLIQIYYYFSILISMFQREKVKWFWYMNWFIQQINKITSNLYNSKHKTTLLTFKA